MITAPLSLDLFGDCLLAWLTCACIAPVCAAHGDEVSPSFPSKAADPSAFALARDGRCLVEESGELWGVGDSYKARFELGAVTIVPALGPDAPRSLPLRLSFESLRCDGQELCIASGTALPERADYRVSYRHPMGVEEHFDIDSEHVEHSFTLHELPRRRGELELRMRFETELVARESDGGLLIEDAAGRGLRIGGLTAIDAKGRRCTGSLRHENARLSYVLPADFMLTAEAPLVVDPTIGGALSVTGIIGVTGNPDVVKSAEVQDAYFVVYQYFWSASDTDIYGRQFRFDGTPVGPLVAFETTIATKSQNPSVSLSVETLIGNKSAFVAVWQQGSSFSSQQSIVMRGSTPNSGVLLPSVVVSTGPGSHINPDIGQADYVFGLATFNSKSIVVWESDAEIHARFAAVNSTTNPPSLGNTLLLGSGLLETRPVVSSGFDRVVVVWERYFSTPAPGDHDLVGAVLDVANETVAVASANVLTTIGPDELRPRISANLITYESRPSSASLERDVYMLEYQAFLPSTFTVGTPKAVAAKLGESDHDPVVAWQGPQHPSGAGLAWIHEGSGLFGNVVQFASALNLPCTACISNWQICENASVAATSPTGLVFTNLEIDRDMMVFESVGFGVYAQAIVVPFDNSLNLGGNCPLGGVASNECFPATNSSFAHLLSGTSPSQQSFLMIGLEYLNAQCGSCRLVPDPTTGFVIATGLTDATGGVKYPMNIPDLPQLKGLSLISQWAVLPGANPCPELGVTLSNALQLTIQ